MKKKERGLLPTGRMQTEKNHTRWYVGGGGGDRVRMRVHTSVRATVSEHTVYITYIHVYVY